MKITVKPQSKPEMLEIVSLSATDAENIFQVMMTEKSEVMLLMDDEGVTQKVWIGTSKTLTIFMNDGTTETILL